MSAPCKSGDIFFYTIIVDRGELHHNWEHESCFREAFRSPCCFFMQLRYYMVRRPPPPTTPNPLYQTLRCVWRVYGELEWLGELVLKTLGALVQA